MPETSLQAYNCGVEKERFRPAHGDCPALRFLRGWSVSFANERCLLLGADAVWTALAALSHTASAGARDRSGFANARGRTAGVLRNIGFS